MATPDSIFRRSSTRSIWARSRSRSHYSCPLDEPHLWEALRYTELNPLRACLVAKPESWSWSSAASHCGTKAAEECLFLEPWHPRWTASSWREHLPRIGDGNAACRPSPACAHRSTMGKCRIHPLLGESKAAGLGTTKARTPRKDRYGSKPA